MTLYLRLLLIVLLARFREKVRPNDEARCDFRVWPSDMDIFGHMTNSRYFNIMDAARTDFIVRCGVFAQLKERGWYPVVVEETMHFRRSLKPFEPFQVRTKVTGADDRHFIIRQTFFRKGKVAALGIVRARFLGPKGAKPSPAEVMALGDGEEFEYPPIDNHEQSRHTMIKGLIDAETNGSK